MSGHNSVSLHPKKLFLPMVVETNPLNTHRCDWGEPPTTPPGSSGTACSALDLGCLPGNQGSQTAASPIEDPEVSGLSQSPRPHAQPLNQFHGTFPIVANHTIYFAKKDLNYNLHESSTKEQLHMPSPANQSRLQLLSRPLLSTGVGFGLLICCLLFYTCKRVDLVDSPPVAPLFTNSIVSTDIDFIESGDPDAFSSLTYTGLEDKEMPDSRNDDLFDTNTFIFEAAFSNGKIVEIWAHSSFGTEAAAQEYADKLTSRLGKLPGFMRDELSHVVLHKGDAGAFSEALGNFIVLYSDNMDTRIANNDLEETVFHETVHASLDAIHASSSAWEEAQTADGTFITEYAERFPVREDLAESALFAYTMLSHPGRLSNEVEEWVAENIPNRLSFFRTIFQ